MRKRKMVGREGGKDVSLQVEEVNQQTRRQIEQRWRGVW